MAVNEIIVVDDCSIDNTEAVVRDLMARDPRIRYCRPQKNGGHLAALTLGARKTDSEWVALLDADDELTPNSIEARVVAANEYEKASGIKPQLVYGDHVGTKFARLKGYVFPYLCKELCLCQTSTMMLGKECISYLPVSTCWNTDDEIVLAIGKHFHVLHSGVTVAIYHTHSSLTRMSNDPKRMFEGVCQLVRDHRADIINSQGIKRLLYWRLRVLKAFVNYQVLVATARISASQPTLGSWCQSFLLRVYRRGLMQMNLPLTSFVRRHFDNHYF
jgi:glycosyltransferase involved in cell wall biosynthesis